MQTIEIDGTRLEYELYVPGPQPQPAASMPAAPTLVWLHEGLGSVALWRELPQRVSERTGLSSLVYSRAGYGGSDPVALPRPLTYMHDEGLRVLPALLRGLGLKDVVLIGHSDGGSIALLYAGGVPEAARSVRGLVLLAPHVFCEDLSVRSIAAAAKSYVASKGQLRQRLARYHKDVDGAFWGWNRAWLDPGFRAWNIEAFLPAITAPVLLIQGRDDVYGTLAQLDAIERGVRGPVARRVLAGCGHSPHREAPEPTLALLVDFVASVAGPAAGAFDEE
ncbi:MAG: alpha/beta hydrolase [Polyangia bacterium]